MIPDRTYELLPAIYTIIAVMGLLSAQNWVGALCSVTLLSAALLIVKMRRDYRRRN